MNWSSFSDFIGMGGYALYVWGSFGMCAVVLVGECLSLRSRRRALHDLPFDAADDHPKGAGA